jgi:hypothetical protein
MCLAHLVLKDEQYAKFYRTMSEQGKYVLMDNGAAEGEQISVEDLVRAYHKVKPTEVILMDTLSNGASTVKKSEQSLEYFTNAGFNCKFMAVPQGKTLNEWKKSARKLLALGVDSIGVSKFLTVTTGERLIRHEAVAALETMFKETGLHAEVHLLGCDAGPQEINLIFRRFDFVRGCDTALSYLFAQAGKVMYMASKRPAGEIDFLKGKVSEKLLNMNTVSFELLAGFVDNQESLSWRF